jgi:hypothetical protein
LRYRLNEDLNLIWGKEMPKIESEEDLENWLSVQEKLAIRKYRNVPTNNYDTIWRIEITNKISKAIDISNSPFWNKWTEIEEARKEAWIEKLKEEQERAKDSPFGKDFEGRGR